MALLGREQKIWEFLAEVTGTEGPTLQTAFCLQDRTLSGSPQCSHRQNSTDSPHGAPAWHEAKCNHIGCISVGLALEGWD